MLTSSQLTNMRWVALPSAGLGEDWYEKTAKIDEMLPSWGLELENENVFMLYDRPAGAILNGEGKCLLARSVIGPKLELAPPFQQIDWTIAPVHSMPLELTTWVKALEEAFEGWKELQRKLQSVSPSFMIVIRRRLVPGLVVEAEILFPE